VNQLINRKITVTEKCQQFKSANKARLYLCLLTYCVTKPTGEVSLEPSTSERQPPPHKRFRLLAQDMTAHSSATAVTVSNTVDNELTSYFADCKTYVQNNGLDLCIVRMKRVPSFGSFGSAQSQHLLSAPASQA